MKPSERKRNFVEELANLHKDLSVEQLYCWPNQKNTKDWLADVAAIFKNLDETDYQDFIHLSEVVSTGEREERKEAARAIDNFVRRKVAEWERYDFTDLDRKGNVSKDKKFEYWNIVNPFWIIWKLFLFAWHHKVITAAIVIVGLLGIDYSLAWRNTLWIFNAILRFFIR